MNKVEVRKDPRGFGAAKGESSRVGIHLLYYGERIPPCTGFFPWAAPATTETAVYGTTPAAQDLSGKENDDGRCRIRGDGTRGRARAGRAGYYQTK